MSYLVLARKYRPRNFAQMAGQAHVVKALTHALEQGRLHHAYLFTGTRGIGKTTVSRILAKSLNCVGPDGRGGVTASPCGVCAPCTEIDADRHVDYIELDAASNRSIDEIRELIERAAYKPTVGRYKVFMIDEAHQLTKDAFNALLKTLEEPPDYLKFVLATTDPERMLPTVLSRCLQFNLRPMAPEVVCAHLTSVLQAEAVPFDDASLRLIGRAARGSMRDALSLTDQAIAFGAGRLDEAAVASMLGLAGRDACEDVLRALSRRDGAELVRRAEALRQAGVPAASTLEQIAQCLQQVALQQVAPEALDPTAPESDLLNALAEAFAPDEVQLLYSLVLHGRGELALMADEHAAFLMVLLRYLAFAPADPERREPQGPRAAALRIDSTSARTARRAVIVPPASTGPALVAPRVGTGPPAAAEAVSAPNRSSAAHMRIEHTALPEPTALPTESAAEGPSVAERALPGPAADDTLQRRWDALVRRMAAAGLLSGLVRELAWQSQLLAVEPGEPAIWRLRVGHESLRGQGLRVKLADALAEVEGGAVRIETAAGEAEDTPAHRDAAERVRLQQEAERLIREDPLVNEWLSRYASARIVPGSIRPV